MSGYLLDTDTLTLVQFGHTAVIRKLATHADADVAFAALSLEEQMRGWLSRLNRLTTNAQQADWYDRLVTRLYPVWRHFEVLGFPEPALRLFKELRARRLNIGLMDLRIGAVALHFQRTVVTRNLRDFSRIPGLSTEDWSV